MLLTVHHATGHARCCDDLVMHVAPIPLNVIMGKVVRHVAARLAREAGRPVHFSRNDVPLFLVTSGPDGRVPASL